MPASTAVSLADHKRRILIDQLERRVALVTLEGCGFEWASTAFDHERRLLVTYRCARCYREKIKDFPDRLLDRLIEHTRSCKIPGDSTPTAS